jgi:hypothetical protein
MSWRSRVAAHVMLIEPNCAPLQALRSAVAFQLLSYSANDRSLWFIGTRSDVQLWRNDDYPFAEFAPNGEARFGKLVARLAAPFCRAFDELFRQERASEPDRPFFGPSENVGELSLGLQIATLLGQPVLSMILDDDYGAALACITAPERVTRIRSAKLQMHLTFENGTLETSSANGASPQGLIGQELDAFVGFHVSDPIGIVPPVNKMRLIAQRCSGGRIQAASELGCPKCGARLRTPKAKQCFTCGANWREPA